MRIVVVVAVLAIGCSSKSRCERAVHKVADLQAHADPKGGVPKADEQDVIDQIASLTTSACEKEGLDDAQLACILALQTWRDLETISTCPAIAAKRPTWLLVP